MSILDPNFEIKIRKIKHDIQETCQNGTNHHPLRHYSILTSYLEIATQYDFNSLLNEL